MPRGDLLASGGRDGVVCGDCFGGAVEAPVDGAVEGSAQGFACALCGWGR